MEQAEKLISAYREQLRIIDTSLRLESAGTREVKTRQALEAQVKLVEQETTAPFSQNLGSIHSVVFPSGQSYKPAAIQKSYSERAAGLKPALVAEGKRAAATGDSALPTASSRCSRA